MKAAGLIIGILPLVLFGIAVPVFLMPSITNNRVDFEEAMHGFVPSVIVFLLALTIVSAIFVLKAKKSPAYQK